MGRTGDTTSSACCGQLWMLMENDRIKAGIYSFFQVTRKRGKEKKNNLRSYLFPSVKCF